MKVIDAIRLLQEGGPNMDVKVNVAGRTYDLSKPDRVNQTLVFTIEETKEDEEHDHEPEPKHEEPEETGRFGKGFKHPEHEPKVAKAKKTPRKKKGYNY